MSKEDNTNEIDKVMEAEELKLQQKYKGAVPKRKLLVSDQ